MIRLSVAFVAFMLPLFFSKAVRSQVTTSDDDFICATIDPPMYYTTVGYAWSVEDLQETGSTAGHFRIGVKFLNPDSFEKEIKIVKEAIEEWTAPNAAAGVEWVFDNPPDKHIRVHFITEEERSTKHPYSVPGSLAKMVKSSEATMLLHSGKKLTKRLVWHEFGHALGLEHEHQNPNTNFEWNVHKIFDDYWNKWTEACRKEEMPNIIPKDKVVACLQDIDSYITHRRPYSHACPGSEQFDQDSIMIYPIHEGWLVNKEVYQENNKISHDDKKCVHRLYPTNQRPQTQPTSQFPSNYTTMYRRCKWNDLFTCKPIQITQNNGSSLEFQTYDEPCGDYVWAWKKNSRGEYILVSIKTADQQTLISEAGRLRKKQGYFAGELDWPIPCEGEAYILARTILSQIEQPATFSCELASCCRVATARNCAKCLESPDAVERDLCSGSDGGIDSPTNFGCAGLLGLAWRGGGALKGANPSLSLALALKQRP